MRDDLKRLCEEAHDLNTVQAAITALAQSINVPSCHFPTYGRSDNGGLQIDFNGQVFVCIENDHGLRKEILVTENVDELIFCVMTDLAWEFACDKETANHVAGQDERRLLFQYYLELVGQLDNSWKEAAKRDINKRLGEHPFDDSGWARFQIAGELGKEGTEWNQAWAEAKKRHPEPKTDMQ